MSREIIARFWEVMGSNDFAAASELLSPNFTYFMPQTGEYLEGNEAFAALNTAYPTEGRWMFDVRTILADGEEAVSDVGVTDGTVSARAITFHTVREGLILRQIEYWPDPYPAPAWRAEWVSHRADFPPIAK